LTFWDLFFGIVTILLLLEATRRTIGWSLPIISIIFLLYGYYGKYLPGMLYHKGYPIKDLIEFLYISPNGIFGLPTQVSATYLFLFLIFSSFLDKTGAGLFFTDMALALTGRWRGGPAKTSVIASSLFGTISGSAVANVMVDGWITIPLMKRTGYSSHYAAAVEATASTGGQIMPPVMGISAFIMAEILGIPYGKVCAHAAIPAILYYLSVFFQVDLAAARMGLKGLSGSELPKIWRMMISKGYLLVSLVFLIYFLISGYTASTAVLVGIGSVYLLSLISRSTRLGVKGLAEAFESAAKSALPVASACACCGIIIGITLLTGLGHRLSAIIIYLGGGNIILLLFMVMIVALILGTGMPTVGAYITVVALLVPAIIKLGFIPIAAHMFAFYFAVISMVTPPVALAAYAAAGIANCSLWKAGAASFKLCLAAFIVPYMFMFGYPLLFIGSYSEIIYCFLTACVGIWCLAQSIEGYSFRRLHVIERIILFAAALLLIHVGIVSDIIGFGLLLTVIISQGGLKVLFLKLGKFKKGL
jgi:TRAP transporter 4TM/12TM fusion protein